MSFPGNSVHFRSRNAIVGIFGFTLLELMVVIGIIAALLVALIPTVASLKSNGRKAAMKNLTGITEQARAEAIKTSEGSYLVFPVFAQSTAGQTFQRYNYRSYAVFVADPANPAQPKQVSTWKTLPDGISIRPGSLSSLPLASTSTPALTIPFNPDQNSSPDFRYIRFDSTGALESPSSDVSLIVFEGLVNGSSELVTSKKDGSGNPVATEMIKVSHLTGRVSYSNP